MALLLEQNIDAKLKDCSWVHRHYVELSEHYPNEWIVVRNGMIVHHAKHIDKRLHPDDFVTFVSDGFEIL